MRLIGFMKDGKGTLQEPEELFASSGTIEVVKQMDGGVSVIEVRLGDSDNGEPKAKRGRKPKDQTPLLTGVAHSEEPEK